MRAFIYLWTFPTTLFGLIFFPFAAGFQVVDGVLELHGGGVRLFLRYCTPLKGGASAMTIGHVVLGRDRFLLESTRKHERIHVRQCEGWGPIFLPAYGIASLIALLRGRDPYLDNAFEREANKQDH